MGKRRVSSDGGSDGVGKMMNDRHPSICIRESGHDGPCNGIPRKECAVIADLTRKLEEAQKSSNGWAAKWGEEVEESQRLRGLIAALTARAEAAELDLATASRNAKHYADMSLYLERERDEAKRRQGLAESDLKAWQDYWGCESPHDSHVSQGDVLGKEQERANRAENRNSILERERDESIARIGLRMGQVDALKRERDEHRKVRMEHHDAIVNGYAKLDRLERENAAMREALNRNRQGLRSILEFRKLAAARWGSRDGYGGRYGALTREEIESAIIDIDVALQPAKPAEEKR